jgi:acetylornithine deacetylase/succinyl-diaminopimelate desuccinylase-like protein
VSFRNRIQTARAIAGLCMMAGAAAGAAEYPAPNAAGVATYGLSGMFHDAEGSHAHGLNERIRVSSLMDGRRFLYEVVKLYANASD